MGVAASDNTFSHSSAKNYKHIIFCILFIILQAADLIITKIALNQGYAELNPIAHIIFTNGYAEIFKITSIITVLICIYLLLKLNYPRLALYLIISLTTLTAIILCWNIYQLTLFRFQAVAPRTCVPRIYRKIKK